MADVSGITAALPQGGNQLLMSNPLEVMKTVQGITNAQAANRLQQQQLLNEQQALENAKLTNATGQQALAQSQVAALGGWAAGMAFGPKESLTAQYVRDHIDQAVQFGLLSPERAASAKGGFTDDMSNDDVQKKLMNFALSTVGPKTAQEMVTPQLQWKGNGQVDYPLLVQPPGNSAGVAPGVPTPAWPQSTGIGAPAGIQQLPAPTWQPSQTEGGQTVNAPSPRLGPFGQPILLPSTPAPGGAGGAGGAGTGGNGQATSGGLNVTTLSPEQVAANQLSAAKLQSELDFTGKYAQTNQQNLGALEALRHADTGAGSTQRNWAKNFVLSIAPDTAKRLGIDESKVNWYDEANKYLTARRDALSGQASTDYARHEKEMANPTTETSKEAAIHMHMINVGFDNMRQAAIQTYLNQPGNQGKSLTDPGVSAGFMRYWNSYMNNHDYRAYMPENQKERYGTVQGLNDSERAKYDQSLDDANSIGVRVTP